jgi:hypothetical protein
MPQNEDREPLVLICMNNVQYKRTKAELLENQAIEISSQIQTVVTMLENDVNDLQMDPSQGSGNARLTRNELLKHMIKIFNNFSFIKNVFEIDCDDLRLEYECFTLKDSMKYCLNYCLSSKPKAKINMDIDPCLPKDVE